MAQASGTYAMVRVPDEMVVKLARQGILPAAFIEFVLHSMDVGAMMERYRQPATATAGGPQAGREEAWTQEALGRALEEMSTSDPAATHLLYAYSDLDPNPTAATLREACGFDAIPGYDRIWEQEFRLAKRRVGDMARSRHRAAIFLPPTGNGDDRVHPMQPEVHAWLRAWTEARGPAEPPLRWGADPTLATRYARLIGSPGSSTM